VPAPRPLQGSETRSVIFNVSCALDYDVVFPSTLILSVHAQRNASQTVIEEDFSITPRVIFSEFTTDANGNRFVRVETGKRQHLSIRYHAEVDCDFRVLEARRLSPTAVAELTGAELNYLFPSRYCQSDRLSRLAWDLFGKIANPHEKVVAIMDWIYGNVEYLPGTTDSGTSAYDTVTQRTGVCRDFAHLAIALCRALNIPARYFTGYAYQLDPPDIHACFECFIGGGWRLFDATRLAHLNGLVRVGVGRDAADASVASVFGNVSLESMKVSCELKAGQRFVPVDRRHLRRMGVALPTRRS
jgi:transglutaminase-like putative cysteine protease